MSDMSGLMMQGFIPECFGGSLLAQQTLEQEKKMHITHVTPLRTKSGMMDRGGVASLLQQQFPNAQMEPNFGYAPQRSRCECAQIYVFSSCEVRGDDLVLRFSCACCGHERYFVIKAEGNRQAQVVVSDDFAMVVYYELVSVN